MPSKSVTGLIWSEITKVKPLSATSLQTTGPTICDMGRMQPRIVEASVIPIARITRGVLSEIAVAKDDALGLSSGSRSIEDQCVIIGVEPGEAAVADPANRCSKLSGPSPFTTQRGIGSASLKASSASARS